MREIILVLLGALLCSGCAILTIDRKTALERQVIGSYENLGAEVAMLASVRAGDDATTAPTPPPAEDEDPAVTRARSRAGRAIFQRALQARRVELFLRDDVDELAGQGCLREAETGLLEPLDCEAASDDEPAARLQRVVETINQGREAIVEYIIFINSDLGPEDRPQIVATLHSLKQRVRVGREAR